MMKYVLFIMVILLVAGCGESNSAPSSSSAQPVGSTVNVVEKQPEPVQEESNEGVQDKEDSVELESETTTEPEVDTVPEPAEQTSKPLWQTATFTDVQSGQEFSLGGHDTPVLIESFAVWCPKCTQQQKTTKELHNQVGEDILSVALSTDPNEDGAIVKEHINRHGFDWHYAVSPKEVTKSLIADFGTGVVNAPLVPMVLLCPDGESRLLDRGHKSVEDLIAAAGTCA